MRAYLLTAACLLVALVGQAQIPPSGGPTPAAVPIDGGASLLLAAGAAYGVRKLKQRRKS